MIGGDGGGAGVGEMGKEAGGSTTAGLSKDVIADRAGTNLKVQEGGDFSGVGLAAAAFDFAIPAGFVNTKSVSKVV